MKGLKHYPISVRKAIVAAFMVSLAATGNGQGWTVNPAAYANSGDITGIVLLDGVEVTTGTLGAFVGEECRGFDDVPALFPPSGYTVFQFLVYSNVSSGETLRFKYYNPSNGETYDVTETIEFVSDMVVADANNPFEFNAISNDPPTVDFPIANQSYDEYFGSATINLSSVFSDPDLDALTYSATSSSGSVVTVSVSGDILTITEEGLGTSTITVTADDGLATVDDVFTVTVNNVNDAPVVANPIADLSPNEGFGSTTVNLSATFSDKDGDALTLSATSADESVVTVSLSGTTLTITEVAPGSSLITVTASDGQASVDETFTVNVNNVNDQPVVSSPIPDQDLQEYFGSTTVDLTNVFTDPDGDDLTLTPVSSNPTVVTAGITDNTLTINEVGLGTSTITITATDGSLSVQDAFVVTVNNVNDAPTIVSAIPNQNLSEYFGTETIDLTGRYTDKDGDALTLTAVSGSPGVVTVSISGNILTITEAGLGTAVVTVTASDGELFVEDPFDVNVVNVNDAPIVQNPIPDQTADENFGSFTIDLTNVFFDKDGTPLTLTPSSSNPSVVTAGISGNILTITEVGLGTSTITINASDGSASVNDIFTVTVNNVNDAPEVANPIANQNLNEHFTSTTLNLSSTFTDPDGDPLTLSATSSNTAVVDVSMTGTTLTITEIGLGTSTVTVTASDGELTVDEQFTVTVTNVNDPPEVVTPVPDQSLNEGFGTATVNLSGTFTDPDGDALTLSATSSNSGVVTVTVSGTNLTITEVGLGTATVTVTASDGTLTASDQFSVVVNNVNDAPEVVSPITNRSYSEGFTSATINLAPVFSDPDGDALTYTVVSSNAAVVTVSVSSSVLTITEVGLGTSTITVTASDASLNVSDDFTVTVNNVNDAPIVDNPIPNQSLSEYFGTEAINLAPVFTDPDGDDLTYTAASSNNTIVTVSISGTDLVITEQGLGSATVTVTASDGSLSTNDVFTVTVNNVNDAPVVVSPITDRTLNEYFGTTTVSLSGVFSDPDGNPMTYSAVSSNTSVVGVSVSGTTLTLTEAGLGTATITVTASDGTLTADDVFTVTVNNVNDNPVVASPIADVSVNEYFGLTTVSLAGVFTDPDGDNLTFSATSASPGVVTVSVSGTTLTITEVGLGTSNITVTATDDGTGNLTASDVFTVTVNNVNDAPVVANPLANLNLNEYFSTTTVSLASVFTDQDGDALTYTATSATPSVVTVSVSGSTLTITEVGLGSSTITVTATDDGEGTLSVSDTFTVTVNNVNDQPVVVSAIPDQQLDEYFGTATVSLAGVFSDPDGDDLTLTAVSSNTGVVTVSVTGTTLTLTEQGLGTANITVTATDDGAGTLSVNDVFAVTVNNVNDAPEVAIPLADLSLNEYFGTRNVSLSGVFSDPDGDNLTLTATSSDPGVVTVFVSGSTLILTEAGLGSSIIRVTATDDGDGNLSVDETFVVAVNNVNDPPQVVNPIPNRQEAEHFTEVTIDISAVFSDKDNDPLILTASSSNAGVVTGSVTGTTLTITEQGLGIATITVTANDGSATISDQFSFTVNNVNDAPEVVVPITDRTYNEYFGSATISLGPVFNEPDGDAMIYSAVSSDNSVVTVSVSGSTLTITEQGLGNATILVTASDGSLSASDQFSVTVNNVNDAPVVDQPVADREYDEGFGLASVSLASVFSDKDGDPLTLSVTNSDASVVTVSLSATTLNITEAGLGTTVITVTATDGTESVSDVFNITVNNVNDQPVVGNPIADRNVNEYFGTITIELASVFSDPDDGDQLTLSVVSSDNSVASATISGTTLTVTEEGLGSTTITVTATDDGDGNLSVSDDFVVSVANVNDAPEVINPLSDVTVNEYFFSTTVDLGNVFTDKDGDALVFSAVSSNTDIVDVFISGTTLTITEEGLGSAVITVTASDGSLSNDDQFSVTVNNVNDAPTVNIPIADQDYYEYFGTVTFDLSGSFSDKDGDPLTLSATSSNTGVVTVAIIGTSLVITEAGLGSSTIIVTASDGSLSTNDQFLFSVNNVNDAPEVVAPISSRSVNEGFNQQTIDLAPVFFDKDGDDLTYAAVSSNTNVVTVSVSGTTLTISEVGLGSSTITVTADDGELDASDQFTFAIDNVNDAPELLQPIGNRNYNEGFGSVNINLTNFFSDPDGDVLTFTAASSNTSAVTVTIIGSTLRITEVGLGSSTITVTATDGTLSNDDQFTATVNNVNDSPVLDHPVADRTLDEYFSSATVDLTGVFSDPDGDVLALNAISSNPGVVAVSLSGNILTLTEAGLGTSTITITADDGALTASDQFTVTVNNVNDAPVVVTPLPNRSYEEGFTSAGISLASTFSDKDGDVLTLTVQSSDESVITVSLSGVSLTITEQGLGSSIVTVTASDGDLSVSEDFTVVVNNVNDPPEVVSPISDRVLNEHFGQLDINLSPVFFDPDVSDNLTLTAVSSAPGVVGVTIIGNTLRISEAGLGTSTITVTATDDGDGDLSVQDQFTVTVNNVNDPPEVDTRIADQDLEEYFGSVGIDITGVFSDPDDDPLTITVVSSAPGVASVSLSGNTLTISEEGLGNAVITVTADDGALAVDDQFTVSVGNVNDRPEVDDPIDDVSYNERFGSANIPLATVFSDKDGDPLNYSVVSSNTSVVTASLSGTTLTLTEVGLGTSQVTVTASDGTLSIDDQFTVTVNNVNDPPEVINPIANRNVDEYFGSFTVPLAPVFSDPDVGDQLTLTAVSSDNSVVTVLVSGTTLTVTEVGLGSATVTVTATDDGEGNLTGSDEFTVNVANVNDAPEVIAPVDDVVLDEYFGTSTLDVSGVFDDKDGDALALSVSGSNNDVVLVTLDGTTVNITEQGLGVSTITLTANDGQVSTGHEFTITVNNVNETPVIEQPVADQEFLEYFGSTDIDLSGVFSDPDGDDLTISATSSNTGVVTVSVTGTTLTVTEVRFGSATIIITASDGELSVDDQVLFSVINTNDAPVVSMPIPDTVMVQNMDTLRISLDEVFSDPDEDALALSIVYTDSNIDPVILNGAELTITSDQTGTAMLVIGATDGEFSVNDTLNITVEQEFPLDLYYKEEPVTAGDTIKVCNDAENFTMTVDTENEWDVEFDKQPWNTVNDDDETTISIGVTENLTGDERFFDIAVTDDQGHRIDFFIKQTENCPNSFAPLTIDLFEIWPNPTEGRVYVRLTGNTAEAEQVEIMDPNGKILLQQKISNNWSGELTLDISGYEPGVYFIRISGESGTVSRTLIRQ